MILRRDLQEASGGLIAAQLGPSSAPRRLNAGNHLSDLIRGGMKRAVLINADLDGRMERRMDGWMDPLLSSTISTSITSADPPEETEARWNIITHPWRPIR